MLNVTIEPDQSKWLSHFLAVAKLENHNKEIAVLLKTHGNDKAYLAFYVQF